MDSAHSATAAATTSASSGAAAQLVPPLSPLEARVLGCLIEKEFTTPDVYPLSLNGVVTACNQRNNREPLLSVTAAEVEKIIEGLRLRKLVSMFAGAEARVPKYKHTFDLVFPVEPAARAIVGDLLLRGPQTCAALRTNAGRMHAMPDGAEFEELLQSLAERAGGGLVQKLPRQTGQKEARWAQRIAEEAAPSEQAAAAPLTVALVLPPEAERRIAALETEVAQLRAELTALRKELGGG